MNYERELKVNDINDISIQFSSEFERQFFDYAINAEFH